MAVMLFGNAVPLTASAVLQVCATSVVVAAMTVKFGFDAALGFVHNATNAPEGKATTAGALSMPPTA